MEIPEWGTSKKKTECKVGFACQLCETIKTQKKVYRNFIQNIENCCLYTYVFFGHIVSFIIRPNAFVFCIITRGRIKKKLKRKKQGKKTRKENKQHCIS